MVAASSKGLGYGIARELAKEGALVSIGARTESEVFDAAETLVEETGSEVLPNVLEAADPDSITRWLENTTETSAVYVGQASHTYEFYSIATDNVGHQEPVPATPDAVTTMLAVVATAGVATSVEITNRPSSSLMAVSLSSPVADRLG